MTSTESAVVARVAAEYQIDEAIAGRALALMADGVPIPYLARYRRESVGGLDEGTLRRMRSDAAHIREMEHRREFILHALKERGNVPEKVRRRIERCRDRQEMEYLYEPYRPARKTPASIARERGLEPLADALLREGAGVPAETAAPFVAPDKDVADAEDALKGAREILAERFAIDPEVRLSMLHAIEKEGVLKAVPVPGRGGGLKEFEERLTRIPSHRYLAVRRAEKEGLATLHVEFPEARVVDTIAQRHFPKECSEEAKAFLGVAAAEAIRVLRRAVVEDVHRGCKDRADSQAIEVFCNNLRDLMLSPPGGPKRTMGVDPAPRGTIPVACVDERGNHLDNARIRPFDKDEAKVAEARATVGRLIQQHRIEVIAIGNGQGRHECEQFLSSITETMGQAAPVIAVVNEVGVGTYSGGEDARRELPSLPVPVRAAVSIARRFIDPMAELAKVEPRQIGVGQYQNDVEPARLSQALDEVVEHCVNSVGVDVNRAPWQLLRHVCGLTSQMAKQIASHAPYAARTAIASIPGVSAQAYEYAAGFLRIRGGGSPLDATSVHPHDEAVVHRIAAGLGKTAAELIGNADLLGDVVAEKFADEAHPPAAVEGILSELLDGGRDPRPPLEILRRPEGVHSVDDLRPGMVLSGRVTNVTNFGAFIDIGLKQDGLVHVSELADRFVKDPTTVVRVGQVVQVRVLGVDPDSGRISLSMKSGRPVEKPGERRRDRGGDRGPRGPRRGREGGRRREEAEEEVVERVSRPEPEPAAAASPESAPDPVPGGMTPEEFMRRKLEELKRRFG